MTAPVTLAHRFCRYAADAPTPAPAVLVSALGHYLDVVTTRLGVPTRAFADTLDDAEWLAEVLHEAEFTTRTVAIADRLATITGRLDVPARGDREVRTDAVWLLMRLDEMEGWTSGWLGRRP